MVTRRTSYNLIGAVLTALVGLALAVDACAQRASITRLNSNSISLQLPPTALQVRSPRLKIEGLTAEAEPGVLFHVYLGPQPMGGFKHDDPRYVGTLTFYDAVTSHDGAASSITANFDLAAPLSRIRAAGLSPTPVVTIVPTGAPAAGANATIAGVSVVSR